MGWIQPKNSNPPKKLDDPIGFQAGWLEAWRRVEIPGAAAVKAQDVDRSPQTVLRYDKVLFFFFCGKLPRNFAVKFGNFLNVSFFFCEAVGSGKFSDLSSAPGI